MNDAKRKTTCLLPTATCNSSVTKRNECVADNREVGQEYFGWLEGRTYTDAYS